MPAVEFLAPRKGEVMLKFNVSFGIAFSDYTWDWEYECVEFPNLNYDDRHSIDDFQLFELAKKQYESHGEIEGVEDVDGMFFISSNAIDPDDIRSEENAQKATEVIQALPEEEVRLYFPKHGDLSIEQLRYKLAQEFGVSEKTPRPEHKHLFEGIELDYYLMRFMHPADEDYEEYTKRHAELRARVEAKRKAKEAEG